MCPDKLQALARHVLIVMRRVCWRINDTAPHQGEGRCVRLLSSFTSCGPLTHLLSGQMMQMVIKSSRIDQTRNEWAWSARTPCARLITHWRSKRGVRNRVIANPNETNVRTRVSPTSRVSRMGWGGMDPADQLVDALIAVLVRGGHLTEIVDPVTEWSYYVVPDDLCTWPDREGRGGESVAATESLSQRGPSWHSSSDHVPGRTR
jgi:hypothetical protein